jgi:hypothetical protein
MANLDITIKLPKPATSTTPSIFKGFPPSLPSFHLPMIPPAVVKAEAAMAALITKFEKLAGMAAGFVNNQTITLILKRGTTIVYQQKVSAISVVKEFI